MASNCIVWQRQSRNYYPYIKVLYGVRNSTYNLACSYGKHFLQYQEKLAENVTLADQRSNTNLTLSASRSVRTRHT